MRYFFMILTILKAYVIKLCSEIGMDLNNIHAKKVAVYTDSTVSRIILNWNPVFSHGPTPLFLDRQTSSSQGCR